MAQANKDQGKPSRTARRSKPPRHWPDTEWNRASRDAKRRSQVYQGQPGTAAVYVMRDALGAVKVGITDNLEGRLYAIHSQVGSERRPVRLMRAYLMCHSIAGRVERAAQRDLTERFDVVHGREWFATSTRQCYAAIELAAAALREINQKFSTARARRMWGARKYTQER